MNTEQYLYLKILAYGLADDASIDVPAVGTINWGGFYSFCESQAILGIGLQCIEKLKNALGSEVKIPQALLLQWIGIVEQIRVQNQLLNKRTQELTKYLTEQGKKSCILKGQGNSLMYPNPAMRTPGDIDVWLKGTKKEVAAFVHQRFPDMNVQYHHMNYPIYDDVEVEVHYYPSFCYNKIHNYRLQKYFRESSDAQFKNDSGDGYYVPTNTFNLVFQLSHMVRHFFTQGIGLRHAIDYFYLLQQDMSAKEMQEAVSVMKRCGMYKFFCAVLWIEKDILGLEKNTDITSTNEKAGKLVLHEMLKGGNFGHQYQHHHKKVIVEFAKQMVYRFQYVSEFPSEPLSRPFSLVWDYVKKRVNY